jgi:hypothetical protein
MADYTPKKLTCAGETSDDHSVEEKQANVGVDGLASTALSLLLQAFQKAISQQNMFTSQACGAKCEKVLPVTAPAPTIDKLDFSHVQGKPNVFNVTIVVKWKATVNCKLKPEVLDTENIQVPGATANDTIATIRYECIDKVIWVVILSGDGKTEWGRFRTDQNCPLAQGATLDKYAASKECKKGYWWIILTDPKTHEVIFRKKTTTTCKEDQGGDKGGGEKGGR